MATINKILVALSDQMYRDVKFVAEHNPTQVVDDDTTKMFNHLLAEVEKVFPLTKRIAAFSPMSPRTLKYKDALVVTGQLFRFLSVMTETEGKPQRAKPVDAGNGAEGIPDPGSEDEHDPTHDVELYGRAKPVNLNDDGTIRFSLED